MVRRFADHARVEDPAHEIVPPKVFVSTKRRRPFPHIFSPQELLQLLDATAHLRPKTSLRPWTYYTLFGLLAATGMRVSEAIHLMMDDITTAVRALESCPTGYDCVTRHILALSTYLGHTHVTDTYWYLQATPHLMTGIADACELFIQGEKS